MIAARGADVVVIASHVIIVSPTLIEIDGAFFVFVQMSKDPEPIEGIANHGRVLVSLFDFFGDPNSGVTGPGRYGAIDWIHRNHVDLMKVLPLVHFWRTFDHLIVVAGIHIGTGGGLEGFPRIGDLDGAVIPHQVPFRVII